MMLRGEGPLCLTEDPRLMKASKGSLVFLRPQGSPRGLKKLRRQGEQGVGRVRGPRRARPLKSD